MVKQIIKNKDGSVYWSQAFDTLLEADNWYQEEITRSYWDKDRTVEYIDMTPAVDPQEETRRAARVALINDRISKLRALKGADLTAAQMKAAVLFMIDLILGD